MSVSGISSYIEYGKQSSYTSAVAVGAATRAFGMDQEVSAFSINENMFELGDLYTALVQKYAFGRFQGNFSIDSVLSNPWATDLYLANAVTTGVGPYTHTYDDSKTVNAITAELGIDTTTNRVIQVQQATLKDMSLSSAINELVKQKQNFQFSATPTTAGTSIDASVSTDDIAFPYTMVHATVESPSATPLAEVQSFELNINPNITEVLGPGSANGTNAYKGKLSLTGKFSLSIVDNAWWNKVRARAEPTDNTLRFKFTNGDTSPATDERSIQYTLTGLGLGSLDMPIKQYDLVVEDIPFTARDLTVVAINNTSTPP